MIKNILLFCLLVCIAQPLCSMEHSVGPSRQEEGVHADSQTCCICLEPINTKLPIDNPSSAVDTSLIFGCRHFLHASCLADLIKSNGNYEIARIKCPYCRACIKLPISAEIQDVVRTAVLGVDPDSIMYDPTRQLIVAAEHNNIVLMQRAWELHANVNAHEDRALKQALAHKSFEAAQWLFDHGAHADFTQFKGELLGRNFDVAQWLVDHGVNPNSCDGCLLYEVGDAPDLVQWLINHGIDVNIGNGYALRQALIHKNFAMAQWLFNRGAIVNAYGGRLIYEIRGDDTDLIQWLISHGIDVNTGDGYALRQALAHKNLKAVQWLFDHGAKGTWDQLKDALREKNFDIAQCLINHDSDITDKALREALYAKKFEDAQWLIDHGAICANSLIYTIRGDDTDLIQWLINHDIYINAREGYALRQALACKNFETAQWLFDHGANVNIADKAMCDAVCAKNLEAICWLAEHGADLTIKIVQDAIDGEDQELAQCLYEHSNLRERLHHISFSHHDKAVVGIYGIAVGVAVVGWVSLTKLIKKWGRSTDEHQ